MSDETVFYRYEDIRCGMGVRVICRKFLLVSETPCGYWILPMYGVFLEKRWVSKTARKRHAYPSDREALESFVARKKKQIEILSGRLRNAKEALSIIKEYKL